MVRYLQVLIRSARWEAKHRPGTAALLATELGVSVDDIEHSYMPDYHQQLWPNLTARNLHLLQTQQDFMVRYGYLPAPVDLGAWQDASFLQQAYARTPALGGLSGASVCARCVTATDHAADAPLTQSSLRGSASQ